MTHPVGSRDPSNWIINSQPKELFPINQVILLGFIVSEKGILTDLNKIKVMKDCPETHSLYEV